MSLLLAPLGKLLCTREAPSLMSSLLCTFLWLTWAESATLQTSPRASRRKGWVQRTQSFCLSRPTLGTSTAPHIYFLTHPFLVFLGKVIKSIPFTLWGKKTGKLDSVLSHLSEEDPEVQSGERSGARSHTWEVVSQAFKPRRSGCRAQVHSHLPSTASQENATMEFTFGQVAPTSLP